MAWVRYDDNFYAHEKVGRLLILGPIGVEALGLHLLANTWAATTKRPGFVPAHQPGVIMANPKRGAKLAALLEEADLWDATDGGWDFHDSADYRASPKRQTPGTPADLSAKRAAAGSKGGSKTAASRAANAANGQANPEQSPSKALASVQQTSSKPCSPVVASNEATPEPEPVPTTSDEEPLVAPDVGALVADFLDQCQERPPSAFVARIGKEVRSLVIGGTGADAIRGGLGIVAVRGLQPTALAGAVHEHLNRRPRDFAPSRNDQIFDRAMERAKAAEAETDRKALP